MFLHRELLTLGLVALGLGGLAAPWGDRLPVIRALDDAVLVRDVDEVNDDLIALANVVRIEGAVHGDLIVFADRLIVTGSVDGDVLGFARRAELDGTVSGSSRLIAGTLEIGGTVSGDVTGTSLSLTIDGRVGRDVYSIDGELRVRGEVGRDVAGRAIRRAFLSGRVGRDFEVVTGRLVVTSEAVVGGSLIYTQGSDVSIASEADIGVVVVREPAGAQVQVRAVQLLVAILAAILFVLAGIAVFFLFPRSLRLAIDRIRRRPLLTLGLGAGFVVAPLVLFAVFGLLLGFAPIQVAAPAVVLLGPVVMIVTVLLAIAALLAPIPVLTVLGNTFILRRSSPVAGFAVAVPIWLLLLLVPYLGTLVAAVVVLFGLGAWLGGWLEARGSAGWAVQRASGVHRRSRKGESTEEGS